MPDQARYFGRAFDLADGRIVLPCELCGTPVWPGREDRHMCGPLFDALSEEAKQRERDAWRDL